MPGKFLIISNTTFATVNSTFSTINTNYQAAYADANTANTTAKNAYAQGNLAYTAANTAQTYGNTLSTSVNSTVATINTNYQAAYAAANTGATNALNAYAQANSAYTTANNALPKAGGTMTGNIVMSAATVNTSIANISTVITGNALTIGTGIGSNSNVIMSANGTEYLRLTNTGNVGIGTATPFGKLSVLSTTGAGSTVAAWSAGHSIFGPNVGSGTGAALGLAYNTTDDRSEILSLVPNVAWKPLYLYSTGLQIFAQSGSFSAIFAANGNVGIGTTSPDQKLVVDGGATSAYLKVTGQSVNGFFGQDSVGLAVYQQGNKPIYFATNDAERMRIDSSGNVGIGATPSYKFHLSGGQYYIAPSGTYTSYTGDGLWGSTATPSLLGSNGQGGSYSRFAAPGMIIGYQDNGNGLYSPAYGFEVKSIDGRPVGSISVKAIVLKDIDTNTLVFYVNTTGNVLNVNNSYGSASDVSIKENITDASSKLNDLLNVRVRNYNLKADPNKLKQLGVIAQELETIFPGIVETDTEGLKSVKYSIFVPMLIKAIQEQQVLIQDQKVLIQSLITRLTAVEAR